MKFYSENLSNNEGYFLIFTMIAIVILFSMGAVILRIGTTEFKQAEKNKNEIKAYYLARSGADLLADAIINGEINAAENDFNIYENGSPIVESIEIVENDDGYLIISRAEIRGEKETVKLKLRSQINLKNMFDRAFFSKGDVDIEDSKATVKGSVESGGVIIGEPDGEEFSVIENSERDFPAVEFPDINFPGTKKKVNKNEIIYDDKYFSELQVNPKGKLTIDTHGGDVNILVDELDLKGTLDIVGDNNVNIFVKNSGGKNSIQTPNQTNKRLRLLLEEGSDLKIQANSNFNGYIYGPQAEITMKSGHAHGVGGTTVEGSIIVEKFKNEEMTGTIEYKEMEDDFNMDISEDSYMKGPWSD